MKIIKKFNDGTALVQKGSNNPEIVKISDLTDSDQAQIVELVMLDADGFVIPNTDYKLVVSPGTRIHIKISDADSTASSSIMGNTLLEFIQEFKKLLE